MLFPAKWRICPRAHPDLCLATTPPGGRSGGWDRSIWEERTPSGRSWRASPPTTSSCSEKPSTRGAAATRPAPARSSRPPRLIGRTQGARGAARVRKVSGGRIAPGSPLVHHLERVHDTLARGARERGAQGRCERPDLPGADGDSERPVLMAEALPVALHEDVAHRNLQAYLDWYVYLFRVNQARDRLDQTARVVRHILMADATCRSLG